ncbi:MAG: cupin domain-containing protein [Bacteroidota bacterium]|nr:cupin domain-containing protein [Bacteroidota bacterium]
MAKFSKGGPWGSGSPRNVNVNPEDVWNVDPEYVPRPVDPEYVPWPVDPEYVPWPVDPGYIPEDYSQGIPWSVEDPGYGVSRGDNSLFPKGEKLSNDWFTGNAFFHPLLAKDKNHEFAIGSVTFEPGARTHWHTHPKGQVLIVTEGEGFYQEKDKPAQPLKKGDVVNIPDNVEHWHGASAYSQLVHIAITNYKEEENVVWLQPVSEKEYNEVNVSPWTGLTQKAYAEMFQS